MKPVAPLTESLPVLTKLTGTIESYRARRENASFVFNDRDKSALGVVAIAAGLANLSGQAIATASHASDTDEPADYVECRIDGKPVRGWLWRSPFQNGDIVDVFGSWNGDHLEIAGMARPSDRVIALYPHCSRGSRRHLKNAAKWWFIGTSILNAGILLLLVATGTHEQNVEAFSEGLGYLLLGIYAFFGIAAFSLSRKWMPFAKAADKVFAGLGLPDPLNLDLAKTSRQQRRPEDPGEFGTFYFRY
jgi:hypothetical protein